MGECRDRHGPLGRSVLLVALVISGCISAREESRHSLSEGMALMQAQPIEAAAAFQEAARLDPTFSEPFARLAELHLQQARFDEAERAASRAFDLLDNSEHRELLGRAQLGLEKYEQALGNLTEGYAMMPGRTSFLLPLGHTHEALGHHDEAAWFFGEAANHEQTRVAGHLGLARLHMARAEAPNGEAEQQGESRRQAREQLEVAREGSTELQQTEVAALMGQLDALDESARQEQEETRQVGILAALADSETGLTATLSNDRPVSDTQGSVVPRRRLSRLPHGLQDLSSGSIADVLDTASHRPAGGGITSARPAGSAGRGSAGQGAVRLGRPTVRGSLSTDVVTHVLSGHADAIRSCYLRALALDPDLSVNVELRMHIRPTGTVSQVGATAGLEPWTALHSCLERVVRNSWFPEPEDGGSVVVDFRVALTP